eukprot:COSAG01_NODE_1548_length_9950_cov_29.480865_2_plen_166_part_00
MGRGHHCSAGPSAGGAVAGGLNCYFGCNRRFSECGLSVDCHFISGVWCAAAGWWAERGDGTPWAWRQPRRPARWARRPARWSYSGRQAGRQQARRGLPRWEPGHEAQTDRKAARQPTQEAQDGHFPKDGGRSGRAGAGTGGTGPRPGGAESVGAGSGTWGQGHGG